MAERTEDTALQFYCTDTGERVWQVDITDFTTREQIETEEFFGKPWGSPETAEWMLTSAKGAAWMCFIARRRVEPAFTYDRAVDVFDRWLTDEEDEKVAAERPTEASSTDGSPS